MPDFKYCGEQGRTRICKQQIPESSCSGYESLDELKYSWALENLAVNWWELFELSEYLSEAAGSQVIEIISYNHYGTSIALLLRQ